MKHILSYIAAVALSCTMLSAQEYSLTPAPGKVKTIEQGFTLQWSSTSVTMTDPAGVMLLRDDTEYKLHTYVVPRTGRVLIAPIDDNGDVITLDTPGSYLLDIEEGTFIVDGKPNELIEEIYVVEGNEPPQKGDWSQYFSLQPTPGAYNNLEYIHARFPYTSNYAIVSADPITLDAPAGAPAYQCEVDDEGIVIRFDEPATVDGTYTFTVPAGKFTVDRMPCPELSFSYEVDSSLKPVELISFDPEGGEVNELTEISVYFNGEWAQGDRSKKFSFTCSDPSVTVPALKSYSSGTCYKFYFGDDETITTPATYTLTIPEGRFTINGKYNPETSVVYTIGAGQQQRHLAYTVAPQPGTYTSVGTIDITFASADATLSNAKLITCKRDGAPVNFTVETATNQGSFVVSIVPQADKVGNKKFSTPGKYEIAIPEGTIAGSDGVNPNITLGYTIMEAWTGNVKADPAAGATVEELKAVNLTFTGATALTINESAGPADMPALMDASNKRVSNAVCYARGNVLEVSLSTPAVESGKYTLVVPQNYLQIDGKLLPGQLSFEYTVQAKEASFEYTYTLDPQDGAQLAFDQPITITLAAQGLTAVDYKSMAWGAEAPHFSNGQGLYCPELQIVPGVGFSFTLNHYWPFDAAGTYTFTIPAGYFTLTNDKGETVRSKTISATYNVRPAGYEPKYTVIFSENFNGDYTANFPYMLDKDGLQPHRDIAGFFYSKAAEQYMPWWIVKDSDESTDRFMASHSYYETPGQSNDWLISRAIEIPTEGFLLNIDVQSLPWRNTDKLSDLSLYITEEIVDPLALPTKPDMVWTAISAGADRWNCEDDWTRVTFPLDAWAGKTIYVNIANQNADNDILCIDNVTISREDTAIIELDPYDNMTDAEALTLSGKISTVGGASITKWALRLQCAGKVLAVQSGDAIAAGASVPFSFSLPLTLGETAEFSLDLKANGTVGYAVSGSCTRLAFIPEHNLFMEETTSLNCGNCPMGMYTMETLLENPELGPHVIPVSVHISSMGFDPMVCDEYANAVGATSAPLVFVERDPNYDGFIPSYDYDCDPTNPLSFAHRTAERIARRVSVGVEVSGRWEIQGQDTTAVVCRAAVRPALPYRNADLRVAFVLTENNVGLDANPYWIQSNYLGGTTELGHWGGWADLQEYVINARYHDVARAISAYDGHPKSLPSDMNAGEEYTFEYKMEIPDTERHHDAMMLSAAIQRHFCELTAIVIDGATGRVINAARTPLDPDALQRYSVQQLVDASVTPITADSDSPAEYFDLMGRPVASPTPGIYIRRAATSTTKVIIH